MPTYGVCYGGKKIAVGRGVGTDLSGLSTWAAKWRSGGVPPSRELSRSPRFLSDLKITWAR